MQLVWPYAVLSESGSGRTRACPCAGPVTFLPVRWRIVLPLCTAGGTWLHQDTSLVLQMCILCLSKVTL